LISENGEIYEGNFKEGKKMDLEKNLMEFKIIKLNMKEILSMINMKEKEIFL